MDTPQRCALILAVPSYETFRVSVFHCAHTVPSETLCPLFRSLEYLFACVLEYLFACVLEDLFDTVLEDLFAIPRFLDRELRHLR